MAGTIQPRWDGDTRGTGVTDGLAGAGEIRALLAALAAPGWVAEDPAAHLLPHLERACTATGSPWTLTGATFGADGVFCVNLVWGRQAGSLRSLRADAFGLIGEVAETTTHVTREMGEHVVEYRVVTGMFPGESGFSGHGHLLHLRVTGPRIPALVAGTRQPR